jgi:hypothetical protein
MVRVKLEGRMAFRGREYGKMVTESSDESIFVV